MFFFSMIYSDQDFMMNTLAAHPLTIGYIAPNIVEGNGHSLWLGIKEASQAQGIRLVTFAGIELQYPKPFYQQANQVYELVDRQRLNGLIVWSSSLASFIGYEDLRIFASITNHCRW